MEINAINAYSFLFGVSRWDDISASMGNANSGSSLYSLMTCESYKTCQDKEDVSSGIAKFQASNNILFFP